jgi:transposase
MKFKLFIGIDVSKSQLDVFMRNGGFHAVFPNYQEGFKAMIEWIMGHAGEVLGSEILFAFEHTGMYSHNLAVFLDQKGFPFSIIPGLELKRSMGMKRGKSDKTDSRAIAEYAFEKKEKIKLYNLPSKTLGSLKRLLSYRERLVKERAAFKTRLGEYNEVFPDGDFGVFPESHEQVISCLDKQIDKIEAEMTRLVKQDDALLKQYKLINTIKGVGPQTALTMIVLTGGFTLFEAWRKFASYAGIAPFPNESGLFRGKTRVSGLANKRIKALLTMCASTAIQHNPEMKYYYERRVMEGKNRMSTLNIIRNKMLSRIFAVVARKSPYVDTFKFAA